MKAGRCIESYLVAPPRCVSTGPVVGASSGLPGLQKNVNVRSSMQTLV